jgi:hypothetical protein
MHSVQDCEPRAYDGYRSPAHRPEIDSCPYARVQWHFDTSIMGVDGHNKKAAKHIHGCFILSPTWIKATSHMSQEPWPWNCESPKESGQRPSQHARAQHFPSNLYPYPYHNHHQRPMPTHAHPSYSNCARLFNNCVMCITRLHQVLVGSDK